MLWPLLLFQSGEEFEEEAGPSIRVMDEAVSSLMRTVTMTAPTKTADLVKLLEAGTPWPVVTPPKKPALWRPLPALQHQQQLPAAAEENSGEWQPRVLPRKYSPRWARDVVLCCVCSPDIM